DRRLQAPRGRAPQPGGVPRRVGAGQRPLVTFPGGLRALNHRDFRVFWTGQLVSLVGTWMQSVAQSWLVLQLSDSPLKLGLIGTFQFAPVLLFSVVAGAIADRLPKRRLILATQTALCLQALALTALVWTGHVRYWRAAAARGDDGGRGGSRRASLRARHAADRLDAEPRAGRQPLRVQLHRLRPAADAERAPAGRRGVRLPHGGARRRRRDGRAGPRDIGRASC